MPETATPPQEEKAAKVYSEELKELLTKAIKGDLTLLPELKKAFDEHPELVQRFGDMVSDAERSLLRLAVGSNLVAKEAITRQAADLRTRLATTAPSELERLLIDRIAISWIEVYLADSNLALRLLTDSGAAPGTQAAEKRLDRAHQRYLAAVKALAVVSKLVKRPPSVLDLLTSQVQETGITGLAARRHTIATPGTGIPVAN
jgi:hypothetical protein